MDKKIIIADFTGKLFSFIYRRIYKNSAPNSGVITTVYNKPMFNDLFKLHTVIPEKIRDSFPTVLCKFNDFTIIRLDKFVDGIDNIEEMASGLIDLIKPTAVLFSHDCDAVFDAIPDKIDYVLNLSEYYKTIQNCLNEFTRESYDEIMEAISPFNNLKKDNDRLSEENLKLTERIAELEEKINSMRLLIE